MYKIIFTLFVITSLIRGEDYYEILGISKLADQGEIRKAFKKLAIVHHPDKNSDDPNAHDKFIRLTTAYKVLKDYDQRRKYDLYGEDALDNSNKKQTYYSWSYQETLYEDDKYIITLNRNDHVEDVINSDSSWFVKFYSPRCNHCHYLAPAWEEVAKLLDGVIKIAAFNCEYDKQFCHQVGIRVYPTLLYYEKNSQHGIHYMGERTQDAIMRFVLDRLDIHVPEINEDQWQLFSGGKNIVERSMLIFMCGDQRNCFTPEDRLIVATTFNKMIDVKVFTCKECNDWMPYNTHAIYLPIYNTFHWKPEIFNDLPDINALVEKILNQFPSPRELTDDDFMIKKTQSNVAWLICFYLGDSTDIDMQTKKISINDVNLGKMHCGRNGQLCNKLDVNRYPLWGMLKPGGAFELHHGKNTNNDIIKFAQLSSKATNVWALNAEEASSILKRNNGDEVWFFNWFTPWTLSCLQFLTELRKASLEFDASIVRFGTIDCTVHTILCHKHKIKYYPSAMLINGSSRHEFTIKPKTAENVIQFIHEKRNPTVIELTSKNFHRKLARKPSKDMWVVGYFEPRYDSCQKLTPIWITVARALMNLSFVNVASVNCETEIETSLCQGIRSYPSIRLYPLNSEDLGTFESYNGPRDSLSILMWITSFFPNKIRDLNPSDYQKVRNTSKHIWIVDFYMPRCWQCQKMIPEFAIVSQLLEKVKFGRINCNNYMKECTHVKALPTLILYDSKQKRKNNAIKIAATTAEAIKDEILQIINSRLKHDEL